MDWTTIRRLVALAPGPATAVADLKADMRKVAIGIVVAVALANTGLAFAMAPLLGDA